MRGGGRSRLWSVVAAGAAVGVVAALAATLRSGAPETLELALYDARAAAVAQRHPASDQIALVAIDEDTVRLAGGVHPLPRSALAAIIEEARAVGVRVVAIDYLLQDPLEGSLAEENAALEHAVSGGDVVLATTLSPAVEVAGDAPPEELGAIHARHGSALGGSARPERFVLYPPLRRFALAAAALGGVSQRSASNGRMYALRHVYPTAHGDYASLPLAAVALARGREGITVEGDRLRVGGRSVPISADGTALVRWYGQHDGRRGSASIYPQVSAALLLRARLAREGEGPPPQAASLAPLAGRIAIVCQTLAGTKDRQPTPVNVAALGAEVLANATDNLLRGEGVRRPGSWADAALALGLALASALLVALAVARVARPGAVVAVSVLTTCALAAGWWGASLAALERGLWLPAFAPICGAIAAAFAADLRLFAFERQDRRFVHDALGRYTSPALVRKLMADPALLERFGGTRQELTVYFSDIRGFTSFSEGMDPERLVALLNDYLSTVTEVIERHGGYVDKYVGDAVMAIWGAPVPDEEHAVHACRAALEIRDVIASSRERWRARFGVDLNARAGINTGFVVAGNVGSRRKTNYTVLGEAVNLASRLEGANKAYGTSVLMGERTWELARGDIEARPIDVIRVVGAERGVAVFEPIARAGALTPDGARRLADWRAAIASYRQRQFGDALACFARCAELAPADATASILAARCRQLLVAPPPADWDGVHSLQEK